MSLTLKGRDSFNVIRRIAQNPRHKAVLIVAIGYYDIQAMNKAYKAGKSNGILLSALGDPKSILEMQVGLISAVGFMKGRGK